MDAQQLFTAGKLREAIDAQIADVKAKPGDQSKRLFLFELLTFAGELDRARRQIDALKYDDVELETGLESYRKLLDAEAERRKVFDGGAQPKFLCESGEQEHVKLRLAAIAKLRSGAPAEAAKLLTQATQASPVVSGELNGKPFDVLCDADDLFGPVLEVMAKGVYFWLSLDAVEVIAINPPRFPRDLIWIPARLETHTGEQGEIFIPALYPKTHEHVEDAVKLARSTDWIETDGGPVLGRGVKTFLVGDDALPVLDWRELRINASGDAAPAAGE